MLNVLERKEIAEKLLKVVYRLVTQILTRF